MNWIPSVSQVIGFFAWSASFGFLIVAFLIISALLDYVEERRQRTFWLKQRAHQNIYSIEARRQQLTAGLGRRVS